MKKILFCLFVCLFFSCCFNAIWNSRWKRASHFLSSCVFIERCTTTVMLGRGCFPLNRMIFKVTHSSIHFDNFGMEHQNTWGTAWNWEQTLLVFQIQGPFWPCDWWTNTKSVTKHLKTSLPITFLNRLVLWRKSKEMHSNESKIQAHNQSPKCISSKTIRNL